MAKCKICNGRIDFDQRDRSVEIGSKLVTTDNVLIKVPEYGKFAYIRRGRWYWHPECYPDKLMIQMSESDVNFDEKLNATVDQLKISKDKNGILSTLNKSQALLIAELKEEIEKQIARGADFETLHNEAVEENLLHKNDFDEKLRLAVANSLSRVTEERNKLFDENGQLTQETDELRVRVDSQAETIKNLDKEYHELKEGLKNLKDL